MLYSCSYYLELFLKHHCFQGDQLLHLRTPEHQDQWVRFWSIFWTSDIIWMLSCSSSSIRRWCQQKRHFQQVVGYWNKRKLWWWQRCCSSNGRHYASYFGGGWLVTIPEVRLNAMTAWNKLEMFYLNSTLNFGISPVFILLFQLEVFYKVDKLLTAQQKGTTAWWYSNKTSLCDFWEWKVNP